MTTDSEALLVLVERVEALAGPCRVVDRAIWFALQDEMTGDPLYGPQFTASIDAAMKLLNNVGILMHLSDIGADGLPLARVGCPGLDDAPIFVGIASCIMTDTSPVAGLAMSLTAAALRARAQITRLATPHDRSK